jgi:hypothetical protein
VEVDELKAAIARYQLQARSMCASLGRQEAMDAITQELADVSVLVDTARSAMHAAGSVETHERFRAEYMEAVGERDRCLIIQGYISEQYGIDPPVAVKEPA